MSTQRSTERFEVSSLSRAVAKVMGIDTVRSASMEDSFDGLSLITVTFIATKDQVRAIGAEMARGRDDKTAP